MKTLGLILARIEIGLLIDQRDAPVPLFDTAQIHAERAVELAGGGLTR